MYQQDNAPIPALWAQMLGVQPQSQPYRPTDGRFVAAPLRVDPRTVAGRTAGGLGVVVVALLGALLTAAGVAAGAALFYANRIHSALMAQNCDVVAPGDQPFAGWSFTDPQAVRSVFVGVLGEQFGLTVLNVLVQNGWRFQSAAAAPAPVPSPTPAQTPIPAPPVPAGPSFGVDPSLTMLYGPPAPQAPVPPSSPQSPGGTPPAMTAGGPGGFPMGTFFPGASPYVPKMQLFLGGPGIMPADPRGYNANLTGTGGYKPQRLQRSMPLGALNTAGIKGQSVVGIHRAR